MNKLRLCLALALASPVCFTACHTPVDQRVAAVSTLQAVGASADTAMKLAALAFHNGKLTQAQWDQISDIHDNKFQPAYRLAVQAVQSDLSSPASPDLLNLLALLVGAVNQFTK